VFFPARPRAKTAAHYTGWTMWEAYRIGLAAGGGVAVALAVAGLLRRPVATAALAGAIAAVIAGLVLGWVGEAIGAGAGGVLTGLTATSVASGSLRRGGTAGGTALLFVLAGIIALAVAFVPFAGYVEALSFPIFALRARGRGGEKYAGLRSLAK
jgi:hypothetical protein